MVEQFDTEQLTALGGGATPEPSNTERQPFRSMGFVSVIIVSVLFALGLPRVLL